VIFKSFWLASMKGGVKDVVKNYMAQHCDFTLQQFRDDLPFAFSQVTSETCRKLVAKIVADKKTSIGKKMAKLMKIKPST